MLYKRMVRSSGVCAFYVSSLLTKATRLIPTKPGELIVVKQHAMGNEEAFKSN